MVEVTGLLQKQALSKKKIKVHGTQLNQDKFSMPMSRLQQLLLLKKLLVRTEELPLTDY